MIFRIHQTLCRSLCASLSQGKANEVSFIYHSVEHLFELIVQVHAMIRGRACRALAETEKLFLVVVYAYAYVCVYARCFFFHFFVVVAFAVDSDGCL